MACIFGHLAIVKYLRQHGCDIEAPGDLGNRPLHLASAHGCLDVVKYLCGHQCKLDAPNDTYQRPIHFACIFGHTEIVRHLCIQGCDKEIFTDVIHFYSEATFSNFCFQCGERPFHLACIYGHLEIVRFLCEQICNIEVSTEMEEISNMKVECDEPCDHSSCFQTQNIMLDLERHVKLSDFGLSFYLESIGQRSLVYTVDSSSKMTFCGTPNYMAPECVTGQIYSCPIDIWSLVLQSWRC